LVDWVDVDGLFLLIFNQLVVAAREERVVVRGALQSFLKFMHQLRENSLRVLPLLFFDSFDEVRNLADLLTLTLRDN
jgi:hypothetical protein